MAFQLRANETVADGIRRCARRELESALEDLGGNSRGPRGAGEKEAVHDVRKRFKKVRAALRLVREDLGDEVYRDENFRLRDAARPLTEVRDAQMLAETWAALTLELASELEPLAAAKVRDALLANEEDVTRRVLREEKAFAAVAEVATRTLGRLAEWRIDCDGWAALEGGLRRVYRTGHRALSLAAETPSVENLHEWRKQAKYLWHGLQLLEATWTERRSRPIRSPTAGTAS
jgi:CHAD domain-containing protein